MALIKKALRNSLLLLLAFWLAAQFVSADPVEQHVFYKDMPEFETIAHGLGQGLRPNNTLEAAHHAVAGGADILEMDIHLTRDGVLVVRHDASIDATTNGSGLIADMDYATLAGFDAGYRFDPNGDENFSWRGKGVHVPMLETILRQFPDHRFMIEMKPNNPAIAQPFCRMIRHHEMEAQVMAASFHDRVIKAFRKTCPGVATSMSKAEIQTLVLADKIGLSHIIPVDGIALQIPEKRAFLPIATSSFIQNMQARNLRVHVWTINDPAIMADLINKGVDGIITDFPRRVAAAVTQQAARP